MSGALKRCRRCDRELDRDCFPVATGRKRAKSDYCEDCWRYPLDPGHHALVLRRRVERLSCSRSIVEPALFPGPVERVLARELAEMRAELAELEAEAA